MSYFHHKERQASIVAGNTLFIDGGDVTTWDRTGNGFSNGSTLTKANDTRTYSIDLTSSWSTSDVTITPIEKTTSLSFSSGTLWLNASGDSFYQFDGGVSLTQGPYNVAPPSQLWSYALNSQSSRWTNATTPDVVKLKRIQSGTYASGGGLGFALGGWQSYDTDQSVGLGDHYVGGMVVFNSTSQTFTNVSSFGDYTYSSSGAGHFVSSYGPAGIFMPFGGASMTGSVLPLDYITMYEPTTQTWKRQRTTGDIPAPVQNACVAGASGDNGTYEIFLFGGLQEAKDGWRQVDSSMYILSLPLFRWFRVSTTAVGRHRHTCSLAGHSQMVSVGGMVGTIKDSSVGSEDLGAPDPWQQQGLGIFDMNALKWSTQYTSSAATYTSPSTIKSYIAASGPTPTSFDDDAIKSWFATKNTVSSSPTASTASTTTSGRSVGAIVAAVVIPVVVLLALGGLAFWLLRRRRSKRSTYHYSRTSYEEPMYAKTAYQGGSPLELHGASRIEEAGGAQIYELSHEQHVLK
ncbi:hypothetical protein AMS68_006890 [Peltaster fructicola]|uniref:Uncharacterized protein n=1 Tax=Peltaster fructicola TaxID=286661 RepID=A0A6H0Y2Y7_9PEZI|nr:hypothetical protein AMS68_006890 [Peltaster fructicola]